MLSRTMLTAASTGGMGPLNGLGATGVGSIVGDGDWVGPASGSIVGLGSGAGTPKVGVGIEPGVALAAIVDMVGGVPVDRGGTEVEAHAATISARLAMTRRLSIGYVTNGYATKNREDRICGHLA
jgi:hypothetical protein